MQDKYFKDLLKSLENQDIDQEEFLMRGKNPYGVRDSYSNALDQFVKQNYDVNDTSGLATPKLKELFKNDLSSVPVKIDPSETDLGGFYPSTKEVKINPSQKMNASTILHELKHADDEIYSLPNEKELLNKLYKESELGLDSLKSVPKATREKIASGLEAAENYWKGHHKAEGLFERNALSNLLKGGKLSTTLGLLGKAAGGLGLGLAATSIGNKAMAGEYDKAAGEAGLTGLDLATDVLPIVGQIKNAITPSDIGKTTESESIENPNAPEFKIREKAYGQQPAPDMQNDREKAQERDKARRSKLIDLFNK